VTFEKYASKLVGLPVSHVWNGYGSALFSEFGELGPKGHRKDGTERNPEGEMGMGIEAAWRIEQTASILCGSDSDKTCWPKNFKRLVSAQVKEVSLFGRLPELTIAFSNNLHLASFTTVRGQPDWTIFDNQTTPHSWLTVRRGRVVCESSSLS
jgi:hypothetical protein